jgi:DNA-binding transcriptional MerR regulator
VPDYRIDELAQAAGMTVRNVRVYQDRGLLPPPRREGRVGFYSEAHLARLRLIGGLLERGYGFAHIAELVHAWERGHEIADVLGLEAALTGPWSDEIPAYLTRAEIDEMYGADSSDETVARAVSLGLVEPEGDRYRVPSPRLLHAGAELVVSGLPLATVLEIAALLKASIDEIAERFVAAVAAHITAGHETDWAPSHDELPQIVALIQRLRPLAQTAVDAQLARSMEAQVTAVLGERFPQIAGDTGSEQETAS